MAITTLRAGQERIERLEFDDAETAHLKARLLELTSATVISRSPVRNSEGKLDYIEVPDNGIRLAATVKALEFKFGKPRQMIDVETNDGRGARAQDLGLLVMKNRDLAASLLRMVTEKLEKSQAIPVEAVPSDLRSGQGESESPSPQR